MEPAKVAESVDEYEHIFQQYLEICNQAIEQNKDKFPYTEIWGARLKLMQEEMKIQAIVYDDRPKLEYMLRLTKDMKIEVVEKKTIPNDDAWPFNIQYLKRVVEHPDEYIKNPAKLEWGWLSAIFGPA